MILQPSTALCLSLGGTVSKDPLSDEETSKVDPQLLGHWIGGDETTWSFVVRERRGQNGLETIQAVEETAETVFATAVGDLRYLSVPLKSKETGEIKYFIVMYELVDNNTLKIYNLNPEAVLKAICDGELTGLIETKQLGFHCPPRTVIMSQVITDSRYFLIDYLKEHGKDCFLRGEDEALRFIRQAPAKGDKQAARNPNAL